VLVPESTPIMRGD